MRWRATSIFFCVCLAQYREPYSGSLHSNAIIECMKGEEHSLRIYHVYDMLAGRARKVGRA